MFIRKEQRSRLGDMSEVLFGARSRWQKILQNSVVTEEEGDLDENMKYVQLQNRDGKPGTIVKTQKAIELGLIRPEQAKKAKRVKYRPLTANELEEQMSSYILNNIAVSLMSPEEKAIHYAVALVNNKLDNIDFDVMLSADKHGNVDDLISAIPEPLMNQIKSDIIDKLGIAQNNLFSEMVFAIKNPDGAKKVINALVLEKIEQLKKIRNGGDK